MSTDCVCKKQVHWRGRYIKYNSSNVLNVRGYVVTVEIEKAFNSLSHSFLLACLKNLDLVMIL